MKQETLELHGYGKLEGVLEQIERALSVRTPPALGYTSAALAARLVQKITMQITIPFLRDGIRRYLAGSPGFLSDQARFTSGDVTVDVASGRVRPSLNLLLRSAGAFALWWLAVLGAAILGLFSGTRRLPAALVFGVPESDLTHAGSDARFMDFCRRGPLRLLREAPAYAVQAAHPMNGTRPGEALYARHPLLALIAAQQLGAANRLFFFGEHVAAFGAFCARIARNPIDCLLWRDFAEHAAAAALNREGAIAGVVITNSNWQQQFLWMNALENRRFASYMALYSLNNHPIVYRGDPLSQNHPAIRRLKVDEVWVWNEPYARVLQAEGVAVPATVVGPILWYLPEPRSDPPKRAAPTICVFDVAPRTTEWARSLGALQNYYNPDTAVRFIDDIVRARDLVRDTTGVEARILLKHKRPPNAMHDAGYFDHVAKLRDTASRFELVETDANLYTLVADALAVVVPPYSSPAYVAADLGVPALFYDATGEVLPTHAAHPSIDFVSDRDALVRALGALVAGATHQTVERVIR